MTLEREQSAASLAVPIGAGSPHSGMFTAQVGDASNLMAIMDAQKEAFDYVVRDMDKPGYGTSPSRLRQDQAVALLYLLGGVCQGWAGD